MSEWTYHAQDATSGAWISRALPLRDVEIGDQLTGHDWLRAKIAPEDESLVGELVEWDTFIYAEKTTGAGTIRHGGILSRCVIADDGEALMIESQGFTAYPERQPFTREAPYREWEIDGTDVFRWIWDWIQGQTWANLEVVVDNDDGAQTVGDVQPPAKPGKADVTYPAGSPYGDTGDPWPRPPKPKLPGRRKPRKRKRRRHESDAHWNAYKDRYEERLEEWLDDYHALNKNRLPEWRAWHKRLRAMRQQWVEDYGDREPYKLTYWDTTDLGQELQRLALECRFEWRERHTWVDGTKAEVNHRIQLGVPRIGVDHDVTFVLSDPLVRVPERVRGGDRYANVIMVLGKGEGRKQRREIVGEPGPRLRRTAVITRKKAKRRKRLRAIGRDERSYRTLSSDIPEVCIWETDGNLGAYRLGDTVNVQVSEGWHRAVETPHRIVGRRYKPDFDDLLFLQLVRMERSSEE